MKAKPTTPLPPDAATLRSRPAGRSFLVPLFLIAALIIAASALGLRPAMRGLADRYRKETIPLRRKLSEFNAAALKSFQPSLHSIRPPLPTEDIGTEEALWLDLKRKTTRPQRYGVTLFVTYYSDPADKVPHTPEVCYRQAGTTVNSIATTTLEVPELAPEHAQITACVLDLERPGKRTALVYVFCANGEFCHDRQTVRWIVGRPGDRYVYLSKIEAVTPYRLDDEREEAVERCKELLCDVLPLLVREHFPETAVLKGT